MLITQNDKPITIAIITSRKAVYSLLLSWLVVVAVVAAVEVEEGGYALLIEILMTPLPQSLPV